MDKIKLQNEWQVDFLKPLGKPGGCGEVFLGMNISSKEFVAIKKLFIRPEQTHKRELDLAERLVNNNYENVINVFDFGFDEVTASYYVVMEKAEESLDDEIKKNIQFSEEEIISIIEQLSNGLIEVGDIIHRDLKPANVLKFKGRYKIADFGIAKFIADSTSSNTLRGFRSVYYASPEQIDLKPLTKKADVYSLGCICYSIITGNPPFFNGDEISIMQQHRFSMPKPLDTKNKNLSALIIRMLSKRPESRPSDIELKNQIQQISKKDVQNSDDALANAAKEVATRQAIQETLELEQSAIQEMRLDLGEEAGKILFQIAEDMMDNIVSSCSGAQKTYPKFFQKITGYLPQFEIRTILGEGSISITYSNELEPYSQGVFRESKWDVISGGKIFVIQKHPSYSWSSSLWFTNANKYESYRWIEVSYYYVGRNQSELYSHTPFALQSIEDADLAIGPVSHSYAMALKPTPIDLDCESEFILRWGRIFADACLGNLKHPPRLPLDI